jgi:hypothetical protein
MTAWQFVLESEPYPDARNPLFKTIIRSLSMAESITQSCQEYLLTKIAKLDGIYKKEFLFVVY